jgi:CheY-like chemotaxis protein
VFASLPARILIVDDEPSICRFVTTLLEDEGYTVRTAANGAVGLELAQTWQPDLIILDMLMPVMDGATFLASYNQQFDYHAPIIACAASPKLGDHAVAWGASRFIEKPFDLDTLLDAITDVLFTRPDAAAVPE